MKTWSRILLGLAAEEFAKAAEAQRDKIQLEIDKIKAEAYLEAVKKWDGSVPYFWTTGGDGGNAAENPFLFQMPMPTRTTPQTTTQQ